MEQTLLLPPRRPCRRPRAARRRRSRRRRSPSRAATTRAKPSSARRASSPRSWPRRRAAPRSPCCGQHRCLRPADRSPAAPCCAARDARRLADRARRVQQRRLADRPDAARRALEPRRHRQGRRPRRDALPPRFATRTSAAGSKPSTPTSTPASPSPTTAASSASPTAGAAPTTRWRAAAAIARIMRSPSWRCCAAPASPTATCISSCSRIVARRADHAVLVVRSGGRFLVLDNGTDRLVDSADDARLPPGADLHRRASASPTAIAARRSPPVVLAVVPGVRRRGSTGRAECRRRRSPRADWRC